MNPRLENILRRKAELLERERQLNIQPRMKVEYTGGKPQGTFDLRSLNKALLQRIH